MANEHGGQGQRFNAAEAKEAKAPEQADDWDAFERDEGDEPEEAEEAEVERKEALAAENKHPAVPPAAAPGAFVQRLAPGGGVIGNGR